MQNLFNGYCGLFGYSSCATLNTFEALVLFGTLVVICKVIWLFVDAVVGTLIMRK